MRPSLYRYVWRHTSRQQLWMLAVVLLSIPPLFYSLNLPKLIVNGPIQGQGFEAGSEATQTFLRLSLPLPGSFGLPSEWVLFDGVDLQRLEALVVLSLLFLALTIVNGGFKFYLNIYKGRLGERMLRRMRYEFIDRILRFPMNHFRRVRPAEAATMIKDELEPIGGFIGDAFVTPIYLMSQVLTAMVFIFVQSAMLGLVALAVTLVQAFVIPRMRRRLLVLGRERQLTARRLAGQIGEMVDSIASVRTNDTANYERAKMSAQLGTIFLIRFDIYRWKFFVKFLNNFLSQVTPFFFYLVGGYFAVTGHLDIGELVAVIGAYRELPSPLKDLIDWDLARLDVDVKYEQVVEQFDVGNLVPEERLVPVAGPVPHLTGAFVLNGLSLREESGSRIFENVDLILPLREEVAVIGTVGSGAEQVAEVMVRLATPTSGEIRLAGQDLQTYSDATLGRRIAYAAPGSALTQATLREALFYPLGHYPQEEGPTAKTRKARLVRDETRLAGNSSLDPALDWIDRSVPAGQPASAFAEIRDVLRIVLLETDVRRFGLGSRVPERFHEEAAEPIIAARQMFRERLEGERKESFVEFFDPTLYLDNGSILENIVFGASFFDSREATRRLILGDARRVIVNTGLGPVLAEMGRQIAALVVELFGDMDAENPLLKRIDIMDGDEIDLYREILPRAERLASSETDPDTIALIRLALRYVEPRHRLGLIDDELKRRVVEARRFFRAHASAAVREGIVFYEADAFNPAATIQDNILFGRIDETLARAVDSVDATVVESLEGAGLVRLVLETGLDFEIGTGAKRLTGSQQQKLVLARALIKSPDYLIVNRALSALDLDAQERVIRATLERGRDPARPFGTFWVVNGSEHAKLFGRTISFKDGRVVNDQSVRSDPGRPVESNIVVANS